MNNSDLKKLQNIEYEILKEFHNYCINNGIEYSLFAGTALGAVRHNGFIPWDDDLDVCMTRENYNKFIELWKKKPIVGYYLQLPDHNIPINHTKIRKDDTIFGNKFDLEIYSHNGIWIDVFPVDKVLYKKKSIFKLKFLNTFRLIYTRNYPYKGKNILYSLVSRLLLIPPKRFKYKVRDKLDEIIQKYNSLSTNYLYIVLTSPEDQKILYPQDMFNKYVDIKFNDSNFKIVHDYDLMLKLCYNDYMQLPPLSEQVCKHNPEILKFNMESD